MRERGNLQQCRYQEVRGLLSRKTTDLVREITDSGTVSGLEKLEGRGLRLRKVSSE